MKTLVKIIIRVIFGQPLSEIEARQKAENVTAVRHIKSATATKPAMSEQEVRDARTRAIIIKQIEMQKQILQHQAKGIVNYRSDNDGSVAART
jgi:hypothetical protein